MNRGTDRSSSGDFTELLRQRLLNQMHLGLASPGDRLPSVRALARDYGVHPKAVSRAYRVLSGEGLVELRARSGAFVARPSALTGPISSRDWVVDALIEARRRGIRPRDAATVISQATTSGRLRALVVDGNRDQLWSVSQELESDYGIATECIDLDDVRSQQSSSAILRAVETADLVVTTAYHSRAVRALVRNAAIPVCAVTMCSELFGEVRRLLPTQPVYFVVSDPRFATKLHDLFSSAPGRAHLRVLVHGGDVPDVPSGAPVYLTRLTRHLLQTTPGSRSLLDRGMPEARIFSENTARELVQLLVGGSR